MCAHEKLPEKRKRRCGKLVDKLKIDKDKLLSEVKTWPANKNVNWSNLAREYGIHSPNGGQTIKMYLKEHNIPAASVNQRPSRAKRRCIRKIGNEGVSFPMYPPVTHERQKVLQRTKEGEINIGKEVVESSYRNYSVDSKTNQVQENTIKISARKISLLEIRKKILEKHESLGILRDSSDFYFQNLSPEEVNSQLRNLGIFQCTGDKLQMLKKLCRTRHIKIWHDHSQIAAHGYLLVLASVIYDPAFFYTSKEMKELKNVTIDVPAILDNAEVHILGRSSSTTEDQLMFVETRRNCLKEIGERVFTKSGIEVIDKVRFFYGDGPAAQFEAGHKQGGIYCCVGCGADSGRFSDIAYSYRAPKLTLEERQEFILQGKAWKKGGENYYRNVHALHTLYLCNIFKHAKCVLFVLYTNTFQHKFTIAHKV